MASNSCWWLAQFVDKLSFAKKSPVSKTFDTLMTLMKKLFVPLLFRKKTECIDNFGVNGHRNCPADAGKPHTMFSNKLLGNEVVWSPQFECAEVTPLKRNSWRRSKRNNKIIRDMFGRRPIATNHHFIRSIKT